LTKRRRRRMHASNREIATNINILDLVTKFFKDFDFLGKMRE
jgi:hypothetical protein